MPKSDLLAVSGDLKFGIKPQFAEKRDQPGDGLT